MFADFAKSDVYSNQTEMFAFINEDDPNGNYCFEGVYPVKNVSGQYCVSHFTQFTYVVGLTQDQYHPERLYNSPIIYIMIFFDLYLLCTLVMGLIYNKEVKPAK